MIKETKNLFLGKKTVIAAVVMAFTLTACIGEKDKQETKPQQSAGLPVKVFTLVNEKTYTKKAYPTLIKPYEQVDVTARVRGVLVKKFFNEGDIVKKGTKLYTIEQDVYLANLNQAKANYNKSNKDYERAKTLLKTKSISQQKFDDYNFLYEDAKAKLQQTQIEFNYTQVNSPIDGIVGIKKHDIGDLVGTSASNALLVTVTNTHPIHAEFSLPKDDMNKYLTQIRNNEIKISLDVSGKIYENGVIDFIAPTVDSNTDTLQIRAKFDNQNGEIIAGNFAKIEISNLYLGEVFVVPENAVLKTANSTIVFLADENNIAKPRPVVAGDLVANGMVIQSGVKANERIITSNIAKIRPDTKIQIVNEEE